jgi:hypothetical protein
MFTYLFKGELEAYVRPITPMVHVVIKKKNVQGVIQNLGQGY